MMRPVRRLGTCLNRGRAEVIREGHRPASVPTQERQNLVRVLIGVRTP